MRIPFIRKVPDATKLVRPELELFITQTKAGSPFLIGGGIFWLVGAVLHYRAPATQTGWIIYGGLSVPVLALIVGKLLKSNWLMPSPYAVLAIVAVAGELAAIPVMIFLRHSYPQALVGILMIAEGAHYLIYMYLHLDYYYFILFYLKAFLGCLFLFNVLFHHQLGLQMIISGVLSLVFALLVYHDSGRTVQLYTRK